MKNKKILFRRKPSFIDPNSEFHDVTINTIGIRAWFHDTGANGRIAPVTYGLSGGNLEFVPKDDIVRIHEYKFHFIKEPKIPTGFHLETKDNKICIIKSGFRGKYYNAILEALKECFGKKWNEIYSNRILIEMEVVRLQKSKL
jgi:hypothetical protein